MYRKNSKLGQEIKAVLIEKDLESPITKPKYHAAEQKQIISDQFKNIMHALHLDLSNESLKGTPDRVAKMFVEEIFYGLSYDNFPDIMLTKAHDNIEVKIDGIDVNSTCEHHFVVIDGTCTITYIPDNYQLGLSKINRIVDFFSRRPQLQERLTKQIYVALNYILDPQYLSVEITATHHCVKSRGVMQKSSVTTTKVDSNAILL